MTDDARWLIADFCEPRRGWRKWRARVILQAMYWFFRRATDLPASRLTAPDVILARNGFQLQARRTFEWGLLQSDLWVRNRVEAHIRNEAVPRRREPIFALNSR